MAGTVEAVSAEITNEQRTESTAEEKPKRKRGRPAAKDLGEMEEAEIDMEAEGTADVCAEHGSERIQTERSRVEKAKKGDRVTIYAGELITQDEVDKSNSEYIFQVKQGQFLDVKRAGKEREIHMSRGNRIDKQRIHCKKWKNED